MIARQMSVLIARAQIANNASSPKKKRKPLPHLKGVKSQQNTWQFQALFKHVFKARAKKKMTKKLHKQPVKEC